MFGGFYKTHLAAETAVLEFWFKEAGPRKWFWTSASFDDEIRKRFSQLHAEACAGRLDAWRVRPGGALALIIILDQFSRNLFRGRAQAYAYDEKARYLSNDAIGRRFDMIAPIARQPFFYMTYMHSENLADQDKCVALFKTRMPGSSNLRHAQEHRDIIARFGRFPHRNPIMGRTMRPEEATFLKAGGFNPTPSRVRQRP